MSLQEAPRGFVSMAEHHRALETIDRLRDELADAKRRYVRGLQPEQIARVGEQFGIARHVSATLIALVSGVFVRSAPGDAEKVRVCIIRKRLAALGIGGDAIFTAYGLGYRMKPEARQELCNRFPEAFESKGANHEPYSSTRR